MKPTLTTHPPFTSFPSSTSPLLHSHIPPSLHHSRSSLISKITSLLFSSPIPINNGFQIFYLSIHYLDILLTKTSFNLSNTTNQTYLSITSLILSLKFIGVFDSTLTNFIRSIITKYNITNYTLFEAQVLKHLNYQLSYVTPYDYICYFLSNPLYNDVKCVALNVLKWFVNCNEYTTYAPVVIALAVVKYAQKISKANNVYIPTMKGLNGKKEQIEKLIQFIKEECDIANDIDNERSGGCVTHREVVKQNLKLTMCITERKGVKTYQQQQQQQNENEDNNNSNSNSNSSSCYVYKKKILQRNNSPYQIKYNYNHVDNSNSNRKINLSKITKISIDNIGKLCTRYLRTEA